MPITITRKTVVLTENLKSGLIDLAQQKISQIHEFVSTGGTLHASSPALMNCKKILEWDDQLQTRLRCLDICKLDVIEAAYSKFVGYGGEAKTEKGSLLYFLTRDIQITDEKGRPWSLGPYHCYVPFANLLNGMASDFHFIPARNPKFLARHPHHKAYRDNGSDNPLLFNPSTCWGGFNSIIFPIIGDLDIVDLIRHILIYLSRYDPNSPLVHNPMSTITFIKQVMP